MMRLLLAGALTLSMFGQSCTRPPQPGTAKETPSTPPTALTVVREISGSVLSQTLRRPAGLAVDFRRHVYVCDAGNNRIVKFDQTLTPLRTSAGFGALSGSLSDPQFVSVDNALNIVVTEPGNRRVSRFDGDLHFIEEVQMFDADHPEPFGVPSGLALTDYGVLWVADREQNRIAVFDNQGRLEKYVGDFGYSGGQVNRPQEIVRTTSDDFLVCDAGNRRVLLYDTFGELRQRITSDQLQAPVAAAVDASDKIWVLDQLSGKVHVFDPDGNLLGSFGPLLEGAAVPLEAPSDILILSDNRALIADTGNDRLVECRIQYGAP